MDDQELSATISELQDVLMTRYLAVAAMTISVYDWALLWSEEYELVGKSRPSLGKFLYYFSRIMTPLGIGFALYHLSPYRGPLDKRFCAIFFFISPLWGLACTFCSYWLLMLRVIALYKSNPTLVRVLYGAFFASYAITLGLLLIAQVFLAEVCVYSDTLGICATASRPKTLASVFYAPLTFDLLLFFLTIYHMRKENWSQLDYVLPLLKVLYRDGSIYSAIMLGVRIWNITIHTIQPLSRTFLGVYVMGSTITVLCSRIYLNVLEAVHSNDSDPGLSHSSLNSKGQIQSTPVNSPSNYCPLVEFPLNRSRRTDYGGKSFLPDQFTPTDFHQGRLPRVVGKAFPVT